MIRKLLVVAFGAMLCAGAMSVSTPAKALWWLFEGLDSGGGGRSSTIDPKYAAGSIVIVTQQRKLYLALGEGRAIAYDVGVGRPGFTWNGQHRITRKAEWPGWTPPAAMRRREPWLPAYMPGGPENPLGARALYIGSTIYRIHGTNQRETIGEAVSSGCFRMMNDDVIDLYNRVQVGARVYVL